MISRFVATFLLGECSSVSLSLSLTKLFLDFYQERATTFRQNLVELTCSLGCLNLNQIRSIADSLRGGNLRIFIADVIDTMEGTVGDIEALFKNKADFPCLELLEIGLGSDDEDSEDTDSDSEDED
jgi:hypothetical protein